MNSSGDTTMCSTLFFDQMPLAGQQPQDAGDDLVAQRRKLLGVDFGRVSPYRAPGSVLRNYEEISSVGWGLNYTLGERVSARMVYGYAMTGLPPDTSRSTVHFQLVAQLL